VCRGLRAWVGCHLDREHGGGLSFELEHLRVGRERMHGVFSIAVLQDGDFVLPAFQLRVIVVLRLLGKTRLIASQ